MAEGWLRGPPPLGAIGGNGGSSGAAVWENEFASPWKGLGEASDRTLDPSECWHLHPGLREGSTVSFVVLPSWLWNSQK